MQPADEVGGDYYDVLPTPDGSVAGRSATYRATASMPGLVMLMVQSAMAAVVTMRPYGSPRDMVAALNTVLYENIRRRLDARDHVTFTLFRLGNDGRIAFAGAHEDILLWRARTRQMERIRTPGVWLGAKRTINDVTIDTTVAMEEGDVMVLYTDGITEARDASGTLLELDRLVEIIESVIDRSPEDIRDHVLARARAWMHVQQDDMTIVVVRRTKAS